MLHGPGFLGTNANLLTDLTLIAELLFLLVLTLGIAAQRMKFYKLHDILQTAVVLPNLVIVGVLMVIPFIGERVVQTLPQRPSDPYYLMVAIHAVFGTLAALLSAYCFLAGWNILPRKIGQLRKWMWLTYMVWIFAVIFGLATYYAWFMRPTAAVAAVPAGETAAPTAVDPESAAIDIPLQGFEFVPTDLSLPVGTTATWLNLDSAPHNVTIVENGVASDNFFANESFSFTFDTPGSFTVYCTLHGGADGSGMASQITIAEDVSAVPAITPPPLPTPTPAPTVPPPPAAPLQAEVGERFLGLVSFFDTFQPNDSVNVILTGLETPPAGTLLNLWLTGEGAPLNLGEVAPDPSGGLVFEYVDPDGQNLLALADGFLLTAEPEFDDDPTPGQTLAAGSQVETAAAPLFVILVAGPAPSGQGSALAARLQAEELLRHVEFVRTAFDLLSIADAQRHTEHIVNLLEGESGEFYGDLDGLHGIQNPGDGYGILPYLNDMRANAEAAASAPDATAALQLHTSHVLLSVDNGLLWGSEARQAALDILAADSVGDIGASVAALEEFSQLLLNGADTNGDGVIAPGEGGIFTATQHAQYALAIPVVQP